MAGAAKSWLKAMTNALAFFQCTNSLYMEKVEGGSLKICVHVCVHVCVRACVRIHAYVHACVCEAEPSTVYIHEQVWVAYSG